VEAEWKWNAEAECGTAEDPKRKNEDPPAGAS